jgi:flagellar basal body-associated protein FliL
MADVDTKVKDVKTQENSKTEKTNEKSSSGGGMLQWIIMAVVVAVCAGAGFGLGRLFAAFHTPGAPKPSQQNEPAQVEHLKTNGSTTGPGKNWFYDLEPVVANLDEPGATRYVRATLTLEISGEVDKEKGAALLAEKKPLLTSWLTIYLASQTLEDTRGEKNLKRIQSQILDVFNEKLFPNAKPQIRQILLKEFAIQ